MTLAQRLGFVVFMVALAGCSTAVTPDASGGDAASGDGGVCTMAGGWTCAVGASCPAPDHCNTCSCGADLRVACTQLACVDGGAVALCPSVVPANGAACTRAGLVCEYGDDPRRMCRTTATCMGTTFQVSIAGCPPPPSAMCPATREAAAGQACTPLDAYCTYGELACHCTSCPRGAPVCGPMTNTLWDCDAPNADAQCPPAMPRQGASCATENQRCVYSCGPGNARECRGTVWVAADGGGCPRSSRLVKRDIEYLDDAQQDRLARDVSAMRLASYEYTDPALAGRRRLGVIIEDQPASSFAVESNRGQMDLYGYSSMILATVQSQARRIEALEREVASLRGRPARGTTRSH